MNLPTKEGWTPLMISCIYSAVEELKILLNYGGVRLANVDKNGKTALQLAK